MSDANEVSPGTSSRICSHINDDHAAMVLGMAQSTLNWKEKKNGKVSAAKLTKVTLSECRLSFVLCQKDVCELRAESVPFVPRLESAQEVRPRLIDMQDQVLAPSVSWLFEPVALSILVTWSGAGLAKLAFDDFTIISFIERNPDVHELLMSMFGSTAMVPRLISFVCYVTLVGHLSEALFVAYHCKKTMKLGHKNTLMWFILVSLVGFKVMGRFNFLLSAQLNAQEKKATNRKRA